MVFMSFWDAIVSAAISITSIPMYDVSNYFSGFKDNIYAGNVQTCEAQAFIIYLGLGYIIGANMLLNIYYLCAIRYNVSDEKFQKYGEPIYLVVMTSSSLLMPIYFYREDLLNPTPFEPFCSMGVYPMDCVYKEEITCVRGKADTYRTASTVQMNYSIAWLGSQLTILFASMLGILHAVWSSKYEDEEVINNWLRKKKRAILGQALMYIAASCLTWTFFIVTFFNDSSEMYMLKATFMPLQGFFNMLIFVYHKVYNNTLVESEGSACEALALVFLSPKDIKDCVTISNFDLVVLDQSIARFEGANKTARLAKDGKEEGSSIPISRCSNAGVQSEEMSFEMPKARRFSALAFKDEEVFSIDSSDWKEAPLSEDIESSFLSVEPSSNEVCDHSSTGRRSSANTRSKR